MKVELLVNLKVVGGAIISKGSIFSDEQGGNIPDFVIRRLQRGMARIISSKKAIPLVKEEPPSRSKETIKDSAKEAEEEGKKLVKKFRTKKIVVNKENHD